MSKDKNELRIRQVNPQVMTDLQNIAENMGVGITTVVKTKLRDIVESYPPQMRQPPKKY